ncbi:MAG: glycosyltransferase family 2 protein [Bacteroidia bacterium]
MPKVSVCIPSYQQPEMLGKCLDSVVMQDYKDYEIIVSDDTPDDSVERLLASEKYRGKAAYYHNPLPLGTPENWNNAVSKAKGSFIKVLHHDDFFTEKYSLGKLVELMDDHSGGDLAFCATRVWNLRTDEKRIHCCSPKQLERIRKEPEFLFFRNMIGAPSATIYSAGLNMDYDEEMKWLVDVDFYIRLLQKNPSLIMSPEPLICTRDGAAGQVTQSVYNDRLLQVREHVLLMGKIISGVKNRESFVLFFGELFDRFEVNTMMDLKEICYLDRNLEDFFVEVLDQKAKRPLYKKARKWFYNSRFNNQLFKLEKY